MEGQSVENLDIEADVHNAHLHESAYLSDDEDKGSGEESRNYEEHPDAADLPSGGRRKRRCRRNRKAGEHHQSSGRRPYKPYVKLSWEERKQVDEREAKRANLRREQQIAAGQAMAPYNTTQFLMEQHEPLGPSGDVQSFLNVLDKDSSGAGRSSGSVTGESSAADLDDGTEELFLQKEFTEAYENFHAERLQMLTKDELIREYVQMEASLESIKRNQSEPSDICQNKSTLVAEVQQIKEENARLAKENELLRRELAALRTGTVQPSSILMPVKDNVDLRQCVDLLTQMLEKDAGAAQHSAGRRSRAKSGVQRRSTGGAVRSVGHQTARKCGTTVPKVRNGLRGSSCGKLARTGCTARSRPIAGLTPVVEEYDESSEATDRDVEKRTAPERNSPDTSSVSHNPVLFNQRLLSSTPLDTPVKRTLVERNGTIFLNGSTDTMILNATDEAMALHPPGPPATGPPLYSGLINFAPNPVQFQCPVTASVASTMYSKLEPSTPAVPQLSSASNNVGCAVDGYSLYSSSLSSKTGTTASSTSDNFASRGLNGYLSYPVQSSTPADNFGLSRSHNSVRPPYNSPVSRCTVNSSSSPLTAPCAAPVQQYLKQTSTASGYKTAGTGTLTSVARSAAGTHLSSGDRLSRAGNVRVPSGGRHRLSKSPHVYHAPTSVDVAATAAPPLQHSSKDGRTTTAGGAQLVGSGTSPAAEAVGCPRPSGTTAARLVPLLEQLREVVVANRESELVRLINEICDAARTSRMVAETDQASATQIPAKAATNIDLELALQPLRSENAELRRQLRIARQQLREKDELVTAMQKPDESFQVLHLTMLNKHLEKQLEECRNEVENLRRRLDVLVEGCDQMMREKVAVVNLMAKKDEDHMNALQQRSVAVHHIQMELETARADKLQTEQKMMQLNSECQQAVLKLQQKDVEYQRSRELIRSLHEMMSQLVRDLQSSRPNAMNASAESTRLSDTINAISERLSHLSFITPTILYDPGQLSRSAKRALNFDSMPAAAGSCNIALSPLSPNHLLPPSDASRPLQQQQQLYVTTESPVTPLVTATRTQGSLSGSKPMSSGPTTVQALLTPIAERMQRKPRASQWTDSDAGTAARSSNDLDRTLTEDQIPTDNGGTSLTYSDTEPRILNSTTLPEDSSDQSRWSATDYFRKYPPTAAVHSETIGSESSAVLCSRITHDSLQRWNDETRPERRMSRDNDDASAPLRVLSPSMDVEFSTLLSNSLIRPNINDDSASGGGNLRHLSSVDDADSTGTAASLDSVSTEDDLAFRAGLAQLDANIARIQQQLHGTMTSSPARNLGRSFSSV